MQLPYDQPLHRHLPQRNKDVSSHENLYMNAGSSFIPTSKKLETIQMSFSGWKIKKNVVYSIPPLLFKYYSIIKGRNYWYTQPPGWISSGGKKNSKGLHIEWLCLSSILEKIIEMEIHGL